MKGRHVICGANVTGSYSIKKVPEQAHNFFLNQGVSKTCVISHETVCSECEYSVRPHLVGVNERLRPLMMIYLQVNARTELALRYNDISPLENHHSAVAFEILKKPHCNIFGNLPKDTFKQVREGMIR